MKIEMEKLKKIVGDKNVSDDIADLYVYASDASVHHAMPSAIVRPKTIEEVQKIAIKPQLTSYQLSELNNNSD